MSCPECSARLDDDIQPDRVAGYDQTATASLTVGGEGPSGVTTFHCQNCHSFISKDDLFNRR
jgi:uncharacterized protein YlaI